MVQITDYVQICIQITDFNLDTQASGVHMFNHCPTFHRSHHVKEEDWLLGGTSPLLQVWTLSFREAISFPNIGTHRTEPGFRPQDQHPFFFLAHSVSWPECLMLWYFRGEAIENHHPHSWTTNIHSFYAVRCDPVEIPLPSSAVQIINIFQVLKAYSHTFNNSSNPVRKCTFSCPKPQSK